VRLSWKPDVDTGSLVHAYELQKAIPADSDGRANAQTSWETVYVGAHTSHTDILHEQGCSREVKYRVRTVSNVGTRGASSVLLLHIAFPSRIVLDTQLPRQGHTITGSSQPSASAVAQEVHTSEKVLALRTVTERELEGVLLRSNPQPHGGEHLQHNAKRSCMEAPAGAPVFTISSNTWHPSLLPRVPRDAPMKR
jgi:hypothetical protein